jgi:hypothetical protein
MPILRLVKRLLPLVCLLGLAVPAASASAPARSADNNGTLSVKDATGRITIRAVGGFVGRFDRGAIRIVDPIPDDGTGPIVSGAESSKDVGDTTSVWAGTKVRFRLIGGKFRIEIRGTGINLSVVGRGTAVLDGRGPSDGKYSFNGDAYASLPDIPSEFDLATGFPTGP